MNLHAHMHLKGNMEIRWSGSLPCTAYLKMGQINLLIYIWAEWLPILNRASRFKISQKYNAPSIGKSIYIAISVIAIANYMNFSACIFVCLVPGPSRFYPHAVSPRVSPSSSPSRFYPTPAC